MATPPEENTEFLEPLQGIPLLVAASEEVARREASLAEFSDPPVLQDERSQSVSFNPGQRTSSVEDIPAQRESETIRIYGRERSRSPIQGTYDYENFTALKQMMEEASQRLVEEIIALENVEMSSIPPTTSTEMQTPAPMLEDPTSSLMEATGDTTGAIPTSPLRPHEPTFSSEQNPLLNYPKPPRYRSPHTSETATTSTYVPSVASECDPMKLSTPQKGEKRTKTRQRVARESKVRRLSSQELGSADPNFGGSNVEASTRSSLPSSFSSVPSKPNRYSLPTYLDSTHYHTHYSSHAQEPESMNPVFSEPHEMPLTAPVSNPMQIDLSADPSVSLPASRSSPPSSFGSSDAYTISQYHSDTVPESISPVLSDILPDPNPEPMDWSAAHYTSPPDTDSHFSLPSSYSLNRYYSDAQVPDALRPVLTEAHQVTFPVPASNPLPMDLTVHPRESQSDTSRRYSFPVYRGSNPRYSLNQHYSDVGIPGSTNTMISGSQGPFPTSAPNPLTIDRPVGPSVSLPDLPRRSLLPTTRELLCKPVQYYSRARISSSINPATSKAHQITLPATPSTPLAMPQPELVSPSSLSSSPAWKHYLSQHLSQVQARAASASGSCVRSSHEYFPSSSEQRLLPEEPRDVSFPSSSATTRQSLHEETSSGQQEAALYGMPNRSVPEMLEDAPWIIQQSGEQQQQEPSTSSVASDLEACVATTTEELQSLHLQSPDGTSRDPPPSSQSDTAEGVCSSGLPDSPECHKYLPYPPGHRIRRSLQRLYSSESAIPQQTVPVPSTGSFAVPQIPTSVQYSPHGESSLQPPSSPHMPRPASTGHMTAAEAYSPSAFPTSHRSEDSPSPHRRRTVIRAAPYVTPPRAASSNQRSELDVPVTWPPRSALHAPSVTRQSAPHRRSLSFAEDTHRPEISHEQPHDETPVTTDDRSRSLTSSPSQSGRAATPLAGTSYTPTSPDSTVQLPGTTHVVSEQAHSASEDTAGRYESEQPQESPSLWFGGRSTQTSRRSFARTPAINRAVRRSPKFIRRRGTSPDQDDPLATASQKRSYPSP